MHGVFVVELDICIHTYTHTYKHIHMQRKRVIQRASDARAIRLGQIRQEHTPHTHTHTHTHTQIFNERATPELSDWDRYAKIEYQRLAMEEDQGEFGDDVDWDAQVN